MSLNVILIAVAAVIGVAYFSVRNNRKRADMRNKGV